MCKQAQWAIIILNPMLRVYEKAWELFKFYANNIDCKVQKHISQDTAPLLTSID